MENKYLSIISTMGDKDDRHYPEQVKRLLQSHDFDGGDVSAYKQIVENKELSYNIRFHALYSILVYYRTHRFNGKTLELCKKYKKTFGNEPLVLAAESVALSFSGRKHDLDRAVQCADTALKMDKKKHAGDPSMALLINYASVVARKYENEIREIQTEQDCKIVDHALQCINRAIRIHSKNGKSFFVRGRLLSLRKRYAEAKADISHALDLLDDKSEDYRFILSEYNDALARVRIRETYQKLNQEEQRLASMYKKNTKEIRRAQNKYIEIITLYSAVLTIVFSAIDLASNAYEPKEFVACIAFVFSCALTLYIAIKLINQTEHKIMLPVFLLVFLLVLLGICWLMVGIFL